MLASLVAIFDFITPLVSRFLEIERMEYSALAALPLAALTPAPRSLLLGLTVSHCWFVLFSTMETLF